ncbi:MAG: hemerythrin domain-containing protein, partial [Dehalococcoidia bacterium]|nr:hemerythrin domain-containing protein [Dehalococcoidia bacterium]
DTESHHQREEQALFPRLEKAGVTGPPRVMRLEHEELRARKHRLAELLLEVEEMDFKKWSAGVIEAGDYIAESLAAHIGKEDNVLYPMAMRVFQPEEWAKVQQEFDRIGYCPFTPKAVRK